MEALDVDNKGTARSLERRVFDFGRFKLVEVPFDQNVSSKQEAVHEVLTEKYQRRVAIIYCNNNNLFSGSVISPNKESFKLRNSFGVYPGIFLYTGVEAVYEIVEDAIINLLPSGIAINPLD